MANRRFVQFQGTLEPKVIKLFAKVKFDGTNWNLVTEEVLNSDTSPISINPSLGIESMAPSATADLTFVLGANNGGVPTYDTYIRLLGVAVTSVAAGKSVGAVGVLAEDVAGKLGNPFVEISTTLTGAEVADDVLLVEITLSNSSAY